MSHRRPLAILAGSLLLVLSLLSPLAARTALADGDSIDQEDAAEKAADLSRAKANGDVSPDRLVIVYERPSSPSDPERARVRSRVGGRLVRADRVLARDVVRVSDGRAADRAIAARRERGVRDAYPDRIARADLAVNDPLLSQEWGLAKIQAPTAWDTSQAQGVKVAVLDCGIHATHPDLVGKVVLAADIALTGSTDDLCNHGTHVAGTIAANTNNATGVAAVAPAAQLLNGKVLGDNGSGFFSDVETGIVWAANNGAKVINLSLGADIACPASTQNAVNTAFAAGAVIAAAAGNSGRNRAGAPANCVNVIGVAATDVNDAKPRFSNYGANVDVAAPGVSILSTVNPNVNAGAEYAFFSGTSMATPHTSGVAALLWATTYGTSPTAVQNRLFATADPIPGTGTLWTYGRINAASAVAGGALGTHDVAITTVGAPLSVTQGGTATISATVANQGTLTEPSVTVTLTDTTAGAAIGSQTVANLASGASATVAFTWNTTGATGGNHVLTAAAAQVPGETNTANNSQSATVRVDAHDVAVTAVNAPASVTQGTAASVTVDVLNQGNFSETFSVTLADTPAAGGTAGTITGSPASVTLLAGATQRLTFSWSTTGATTGAHTLTANASTVAGEANTANNTKSVTARVDTHDVAVTGVTATPASVSQGQSASIGVGLANLGTAAETFTVTLTDTPPGGASSPVASQQVSLAAGATGTIAFTWTTSAATAAGSHALTATASTVSGETNTANNSGSTTVSVTVPTVNHDVAVTAITSRPDIGAGDPLTIQVNVANLGGATETFPVSVSEAPDGTSVGTQTVTLAPGASTTLTFTWFTSGATTLGTHTLSATASLAGDSNPANNTATTTVAVGD